jgi:hypothetical protein
MRRFIEDYRRDWRRWSRAERIAAVTLLAFLLIGAAAVLAATPHPLVSV